MTQLHTKHFAVDATSFKFDDDSRTFSGYAAKFGNIDSHGDIILPGAFAETLVNRSREIQLKFQHTGPVIGKWLELYEDENGLVAKGQLTPGHSVAEDTYASLKFGAISGLSIGYRIPPNGSEIKQGINYLKRVELVEISVVESPANIEALVAEVKTDITSEKAIEKSLRQIGLSRRQAKRFMAEGITGLMKSDAEEEAEELAKALQSLNQVLTA